MPEWGEFDPAHPLGCHRWRVGDRIAFDKLAQVPDWIVRGHSFAQDTKVVRGGEDAHVQADLGEMT
ncbi:hypothetical protein ACH429_25560 [Streptomyces pathocidini]|uniref:Uncharacterized protein n=1 Tax=Streptomyces pathocidini TaxID=1650571 RepID=A0ABW7UY63_9ACTN